MDELFKEALGEALCANTLNEATFSDDIAKYEPLLFPLIKKIYPQSLVEQIASVQPTKAPSAKISYLNAFYTADDTNVANDIHWTNSRMMTLAVAASGSVLVGQTYQVSGAWGTCFAKVFYGEVTNEYVTTELTAGKSPVTGSSLVPTYWNIVVAEVTGSLAVDTTYYKPLALINSTKAGNTIGGQTILYSTTNRNTIKKVFRQYSNVLEANTDLRQVNFEVATKMIDTTSRKIKSIFTQEKLDDYLALYKEKAYDLVAEAIANEVRQDIDREVIEFLKDTATPMQSDINLPLSLGAGGGGGLDSITYDVVGSIYLAAEEIVKATKRNRTMFILADSATCAFLLLNPFHTEAKTEESNPYLVGKVGAYDLFCDPYSTEHYVVVGYNFKSKDKHDAGLYFTPYMTSIHEAPDAAMNFEHNFLVMNRYGFTNHPQDSGKPHQGNSDFFRIFSVNFTYAGTTIPNFPEQFRTNY